MSNPVRRHRLFVAAQQSDSLSEAANLSHASNYELLLFKLQQDMAQLGRIESIARKAEVKQGMLPTYQPWVAGVLAKDSGEQDDILMRMLIWHLDVGDITRGLDIAQYAIKHDLETPDSFKRTTACLIAEEVAAIAQRTLTDQKPLDTPQLLRAQQILTGQDMPDMVCARLHKFVGYALRQDGDHVLALANLKTALQLDDNSGVKTDIKNLEKLIKAAS
ncbi:phage terminase small subunit [Yersinia enterocolitica]